MRAVFDDGATLRRYVETEVALARVQAGLGIIPQPAADAIATCADAARLDLDVLKTETEIVGYPILPLVRQLARMCGPDRKSTRLNSSHYCASRMSSFA